MGPFAIVDAGTNTMRLLIASVESGRVVDHLRLVRYARLGEGVDATGQFCDEAMERGWAICEEYAPLIRQYGCVRGRFVATSASRDASNRETFFARVHEILGFPAEVIPGEEEAALSYAGALSGAQLNGEPVVVMDSGGGSTELVYGTAEGVTQAISLNIGSRRIRERFLPDDPPSLHQVEQARAFVRAQLETAPFDLTQVGTFIGVAGTVTTMAALMLGLQTYDRDAVHRSAHSVDDVHALTERLLTAPISEVLTMGPVPEQRAPVLCAGAVIVDEVAMMIDQPLQACESDILDGVALSMAQGAGHPID